MNSFHLTGVFWPEGGVYVSKCPELGVASCGDTVEEAMANLREAVELYLENARRLGILETPAALTSPERFTTQFEVQLR
jgi:predicted RNase H-like HicB family nuclease